MSDEQHEGNINYKSINCEGIPEIFLDKLIAKKYFSEFGRINRFILRPKRLGCTVEYENEADAERAYMEAGNYNGHEFMVSYSERKVGHVQNTEEWVDPEVQAELDAMNPSSQYRSMRPPPTTAAAAKFLGATRIVKSTPLPTAPAQHSVQRIAKTGSSAQAGNAEIPKVDMTVRMELEALLRRPALTSEDKYRVLDARDKLIRLTTVRQTDIKKAVSTRGTCPDMCPEKERVMREFQHQVANFELPSSDSSDEGISHRHAIKEYSRSSADQEVPLSHELRAENVLQMTMLYLMHHIMDLCDDPQVALADWFHFVWDRTRSIRKDITQQELCSLAAVQLVEQCARFHIHCRARLVAEDPSVFDTKINAENLTKCLQTLKYMYHDLGIKKIFCPREAEFRSYIILLNLGDSNFLWELKQSPEHIQSSKEIKRAIEFCNALQNNNYVHFFSMMRSPETSYMSACILIGYFYKLRLRALQTIVKAHRRNDMLRLSYLTHILGFENTEAAATFFRCHGLQCDEEHVLLGHLKKPEFEYTMERAIKLVESKRHVSVGESICGEPLPSIDIFKTHQPHNSFNANGVLKPEAWTAEDQLRGEARAAAAKAMERKLQQQKQASAAKTALTSAAKNDLNIFKIPQASQTKPQQQQPSASASIFGGKQFALPTKAATTTTAPTLTIPTNDFKFVSPAANVAPAKTSSGNIFGNNSVATAANTSTSIFKIPSVAAARQPPTDEKNSHAPGFFNSIFKSNTEQPSAAAGANIFGVITATTSSADESKNIFGSVAKETVNIFQKQAEPEPMKNDNIFKYYQQQQSNDLVDNKAPAVGKTIFGATGIKSSTNELQLTTNVDPRKERAAQLQRMRELEAEHERKQKQIEEERKKMHELQAKQAKLKAAAEAEAAAARERAEKLKKLQTRAEDLQRDHLEIWLTEEIASIAETELKLYQALETRSAELTAALLMEVLSQEVEEIGGEEYAMACHSQMLLNRYFQRWLQLVQEKRKQRQLMETMPLWVTTETLEQQTAQLKHPREHENLRMIKRYRHGEACDFKTLLWQRPFEEIEKSVDFFEIVAKCAQRRQAVKSGLLQVRKYFKLLLTLPHEHEELPGFQSLCNKWLRKHLKMPSKEDNINSVAYICHMQQDVALCVRKLSGISPVNECGERVSEECHNAAGIICFMSCQNVQNTRKRINNLLQLRSCAECVPIAFVVYDCKYDALELSDILELDSLVESQIISSYKFYGCMQQKSAFHFAYNLTKAARFVARESSFNNAAADSLEMQTLQNFLACTLGEEMWQRWCVSAEQNPAFSKVCSLPQHVIGIYHLALSQLHKMLIDEELQNAPEFPIELRPFVSKMQPNMCLGLEYFPQNWKNPARKQKLSQLLEQCKLPSMEDTPPNTLEDYELWLLNYASLCIAHDELAATATAYEAIKALITQLNREELQQESDDVDIRLTMVNFLPVIKMLVFGHINNILTRETSKSLPSEVFYRQEALVDYQHQPWWLDYAAVEAVTVDYTLLPAETITNGSGAAASGAALNVNGSCESTEDLQTIIKKAERTSRRVEQKLYTLKNNTNNSTTNALTHELDESLHQFELAKKCGTFDFSFVTQITDECDAALKEAELAAEGGEPDVVVAKYSGNKKRKHHEVSISSEIGAIMERAYNIIEKVETQHDREVRAVKSSKINFD